MNAEARKWAREDDLELIRMVENGSSWATVADELSASVDECKARHALVAKSPPSRPAAETTRTSAGLRDTLFDTMEALMTGRIEAGDAKAVATLASAICKTVELEMEAEKLRRSSDSASPLSALRLGVR